MYRKPRGGGSQSILNLDSLMDILSCLVGVMLFLVIYTVLELGSTTYQVTVPVPLDRPEESRRVLVVANDGSIRLLDPERPLADLTAGLGSVPFAETLEYVQQINLSPPTDDHFRYELEYDEERGLLAGRDSALTVLVDALPDEPGDDLDRLGTDSDFEAVLSLYEPALIWLDFGVDGESLAVFRRARQIAEQRGFATRWGPLTLDFPVRFSLNDEAGGPAPRDLLSKPRR